MTGSGSSLVEQILASHKKVFGGGEIPYIQENVFKRLIKTVDIMIGKTSMIEIDSISIYPANMFSTQQSTLEKAINQIQLDLGKQVDFFKSVGKNFEAKRLNNKPFLPSKYMGNIFALVC